MFDSDNPASPLAAPSIDELPCLVQLPASWLDQYGGTSPMDGDQRRFPRRVCGAAQAKAALEYRTTLPSHARAAATHAVYPVSVSRGGLAFLHSEPLYPCEKFRLWFSDGNTYEIEVTRCRRIGTRCFEIGARF